uniref:Secreted protein n=1 Tax=Babesia bovis TaxID=5865 RepID=S6B0Z6_BABBO|nr:hypothetical protein [Babesia bovis]
MVRTILHITRGLLWFHVLFQQNSQLVQILHYLEAPHLVVNNAHRVLGHGNRLCLPPNLDHDRRHDHLPESEKY